MNSTVLYRMVNLLSTKIKNSTDNLGLTLKSMLAMVMKAFSLMAQALILIIRRFGDGWVITTRNNLSGRMANMIRSM